MALPTPASSSIGRPAEFAAILRDEEPFARSGAGGLQNVVNAWFDRLIVQSGIALAPSLVLWLSACSASVGGLLLFVLSENVLAAAVGVVIGGLLPVFWAGSRRAQRQRQIRQQLPLVLDRLTQFLRAGKSLAESIELVAVQAPEPLGRELAASFSRFKVGLPLDEALADLQYRTGATGTRQLVAVAALQQRSGANPFPALERLVAALREDNLSRERWQAVTSVVRTAALVAAALPWVVAAAIALVNPQRLGAARDAWEIAAAICLQACGLVGYLWLSAERAQSQSG
jgi:tight adherence protein B